MCLPSPKEDVAKTFAEDEINRFDPVFRDDAIVGICLFTGDKILFWN